MESWLKPSHMAPPTWLPPFRTAAQWEPVPLPGNLFEHVFIRIYVTEFGGFLKWACPCSSQTSTLFFLGVPYFSKELRILYSLHHLRRLAAVDLLLLSRPEVNCIFQLLVAVVFPTPKARPCRSPNKTGTWEARHLWNHWVQIFIRIWEDCYSPNTMP